MFHILNQNKLASTHTFPLLYLPLVFPSSHLSLINVPGTKRRITIYTAPSFKTNTHLAFMHSFPLLLSSFILLHYYFRYTEDERRLFTIYRASSLWTNTSWLLHTVPSAVPSSYLSSSFITIFKYTGGEQRLVTIYVLLYCIHILNQHTAGFYTMLSSSQSFSYLSSFSSLTLLHAQ